MMRLSVAITLTLLGGCSSLDDSVTPPGPSVYESTRYLGEVTARSTGTHTDHPKPAEVLSKYQQVATRIDDPELRYQVDRRIASLQLAQGNYDEASTSLAQLLDDPQSQDDAGSLRYQLAYSNDVEGNTQAMLDNLNATIETSKDTKVKREAQFRRAETRFSRGDYQHAAEDYASVAHSASPYQLHALYMLAWSRFKLGQLDAALQSMLGAMQMLDGAQSAAEQELRQDLTRVFVITLDYESGPKTLAKLMDQAGRPAWQMPLYAALADWYRHKQRFEDSAKTWQTFVDQNPMNEAAPATALKVIATYRDAGFIEGLDTRKQDFVDHYCKAGKFYAEHGDAVFTTYANSLREFIEDLAANAHAKAQHSQKPQDFATAAHWYGRWLENFAGALGGDEQYLLMAEALEGAKQLPRAIETWRHLVTDYPASQHTREASYAIVIDLAALASNRNKSSGQDASLLDQRIAANRAFATRYSEDKRAPATLVEVAKLEFDADRFEDAAATAEQALSQWQLDSLWRTTMLIAAHSQFALKQYQSAQIHYQALLTASPSDKEIRERLLASVFKQGQAAEAAGNFASAINLYQQLTDIDPKSQVAVDTQYDMAALYEKTGQLDKAVAQLVRFREAHPGHRATAGISLRLANYDETLQHFAAAGEELLRVNAASPLDAAGRQALYHAGELFLKANDTAQAIDAFRTYAHRYETPPALRMEAMQHMDLLYQKTGEANKRRYWLRKKVKTFASLDTAAATPHMRYLAADAAFQLAADKLARFRAITLKLPLKKNLARKRKAMKSAIAAYKQVSQYDVAELTTAATFNTALIYQNLAKAIMESEHPRGLNQLEDEQYSLLLEEQAYPFEEQAIGIHEANLQYSWQQGWDDWSDKSLASLCQLSPARFQRKEVEVAYADTLY